jgi:ATP-dependent phosphoenolpyruvate carboxykinase
LVAKTGKRTGRSPKDRFIVEDDVTRERVDWGAINKPFSSQAFEALLDKAMSYLGNLEEFYVVDAYAGADPRYRLNLQVATEYAWHALFAHISSSGAPVARSSKTSSPSGPLSPCPNSSLSLRRTAPSPRPS